MVLYVILSQEGDMHPENVSALRLGLSNDYGDLA